VTHRLEDAFAVGHRLAVMREGGVEQVGSIEEVARLPSNRHVARIVGLRNLFQARVSASTVEALVLIGKAAPGSPRLAAASRRVGHGLRPPGGGEGAVPGRPFRKPCGATGGRAGSWNAGRGPISTGCWVALPTGARWRCLLAAPVQRPAPAAGSVVELSIRPEGVVVLIRTPRRA